MIGQKIRELRIMRGLTQIELANGIATPSMISLIETDKANPSPKLLQRIAEKLGVALDYFLDESISPWEALGTYNLAKALLLAGQYDEAYTLLQQIKGSASIAATDIQLLLGQCLFYMGRYQQAIETFEQVLEMQTAPYERQVQFQCFYMVGQVYMKQHNYTLAKHFWYKAYKMASRFPNIDSSAVHTLLLHLAHLCFQTGQKKEAISLITKAKPLQEGKKTIRSIAHSFVEKARFAQEDANFKLATDYSHRAVSLFEGIQTMKAAIDQELYDSLVQGEKGNTQEAIASLLRCKKSYLSIGIDTELSFLHRECAELFLQLLDFDSAFFHGEKALDFAKNEKERGYGLRTLSLIYKHVGDLTAAVSRLKDAIHIFEKYNMYEDLTKSYSLLSEIFAALTEKKRETDT